MNIKETLAAMGASLAVGVLAGSAGFNIGEQIGSRQQKPAPQFPVRHEDEVTASSYSLLKSWNENEDVKPPVKTLIRQAMQDGWVSKTEREEIYQVQEDYDFDQYREQLRASLQPSFGIQLENEHE